MNNLRIGVVEDRHDPLKMGRVRVRVFGVHNHERKVELPIESLPWSLVVHSPLTPTPAGNVHQLKEGTWVVVAFLDENCQDSIVLGSLPSNYEEQPNYEEGFSDPFGVLPRWHGFESDTSLVTKEEEWKEHPTYHQRNKNRIVNVSVAGGDTWDELPLRGDQLSFYPYNSVREFESGSIEEYDSTPKNSRISQLHRSGTYSEILHDGTHTLKIVSDNYTITLGNNRMYVEGDYNLTIGGNMNLLVENDLNINVKGSINAVSPTMRFVGNSSFDGTTAFSGNASFKRSVSILNTLSASFIRTLDLTAISISTLSISAASVNTGLFSTGININISSLVNLSVFENKDIFQETQVKAKREPLPLPNVRFPLPDIKKEIESAGRYTGPLVPGAADEAAK